MAFAAKSISAAATLPSSIAVGQSGVMKMTITNTSDGANSGDSLELGSLVIQTSCAERDCSDLDFNTKNVTLAAGTGEAGTACAGVTFHGSSVGNYWQFDTTSRSSAVTLSPPSAGALATCIVDFTATVELLPATDVDPATAGTQTYVSMQAATKGAPGVPVVSSNIAVETRCAGS